MSCRAIIVPIGGLGTLVCFDQVFPTARSSSGSARLDWMIMFFSPSSEKGELAPDAAGPASRRTCATFSGTFTSLNSPCGLILNGNWAPTSALSVGTRAAATGPSGTFSSFES